MSSPRGQRRTDEALAACLGPGAAVRAYARGKARAGLVPVGCAVTDAGVVLVSVAVGRRRPKAVLARVPHGALFPPNITVVGTRAVRVNLGTRVVRFRRADYDGLATSVGADEKGPIVAIPDSRLA